MADRENSPGLCGAAPERAPGVQCDRDGHRRRQQRERELCRLPVKASCHSPTNFTWRLPILPSTDLISVG